jgi:peptidoglycan hydrolase-like protein with peptidoglycan-binding domain
MVAPTSSTITSSATPTSTPIERAIGGFDRWTQWTPRLLGIIVGILILGLGNAAMALQRGDQGPEVSELQTRMMNAGCYNGPVTGTFGGLTEAGVMACQSQLGLTVDGIAGSETLARLQGTRSIEAKPFQGFANPTSYANPNQSVESREDIIQKGSEGATVSNIQTQLKRLGFYAGSIDGVYGNQTEAAVRQFQQVVQLPVDGKVGTQEIAALESYQPPTVTSSAPTPMLSQIPLSQSQLALGDDHPDVGQLQDRLRSAGFFQGNSTQYYGSITRQSVIDFQRSRGLNVTGIADATTLESLGLQPNYNARAPQQIWNQAPMISSGSRTPVQSLQASPASPNSRYIVVIPKENELTLSQVRRVVRSAQVYPSRKGDYIAAGTYTKRAGAEKRSNYLRSIGFDARVDYQ